MTTTVGEAPGPMLDLLLRATCMLRSVIDGFARSGAIGDTCETRACCNHDCQIDAALAACADARSAATLIFDGTPMAPVPQQGDIA